VPEDFRFVVKAPAMVSDALRRDPASGAPLSPNPAFLGPALALQAALQPAAQGLGTRLGVLVFQLLRLPPRGVDDPQALWRALDALWPGPLVCRWNRQRGQRHAQARDRWAPFDRLQAPELATRATLARVLRATLEAGHEAFVTVNDKAEGCAPASVLALAQALAPPHPSPHPTPR
jgi:uncharacterized protein YecE (DUF72 family)